MFYIELVFDLIREVGIKNLLTKQLVITDDDLVIL